MNPQQRRQALALASIFSFRMMGLFMVLPVLSLYSQHLDGATPALVGMALGIYGLFQGLLQIPLGVLSDRFGRKLIIALGLTAFIVGSIVAALASSIYGVILGRALQGSGAVGSTILALMADITPAEKRTQAMALIGMMIGSSFFIAMILGPILNHWAGLSGIFWFTAVLASMGIAVLVTLVPTPVRPNFHQDVETAPRQIIAVLKQPQLLKLDGGIAVQHGALTALFVALPLILRQDINLAPESQAYFYLPVLVPAFILMLPLVIIAEKKRQIKRVFISMVAVMLTSTLIMGLGNRSISIVAGGLFAFFTAFSALEALLPSLVSKHCPVYSKGTAMGVYSACQFLGIFLGGMLGGYLMQHAGFAGVFGLITAMLALWLIVAFTMGQPPYLTTRVFDTGLTDYNTQQACQARLMTVDGIHEATIMANTGVAYIKLDTKIVEDSAVKQIIQELRSSHYGE